MSTVKYVEGRKTENGVVTTESSRWDVKPGLVLQRVIESARAMGSGVRSLVYANLVIILALWDLQPRATVLRLCVAVISFTAPALTWWGSGLIADSLTGGRSGMDLFLASSLYVVGWLMHGVMPVMLGALERMSDGRIFEHVFGKFSRKMITFNREHLADSALSDLIKQVRERAVWRMMAMAKIQPQIIRFLGTIVIAAGILLWNAPRLLPILLVCALPSIILELRHAKLRCEMEERLAPKWTSIWGDLTNVMAAPSLVMLRNFGAHMWFAHRYRSKLQEATTEEYAIEIESAPRRVLAAAFVAVGLALCLKILVDAALAGELKIGSVLLVMGAISSVAGCLAEFASLAGQQWNQAKSLVDLGELLRHPVTQEVSIRAIPVEREYPLETYSTELEPKRVTDSHLELDNVAYRYESAAKDRYAVRGMSFKIPRGSRVAVVGENGHGKSTTFDLILGQLRPSEGVVLLDGKSVSEMQPLELSQRLVMMPQKLRHLNLTVEELLNLGRPMSKASDGEIDAVLKRVGAKEIVEKMAKKLQTTLGEDIRGAVEPSGGELQRLILAAVILAGRDLIILDEPVSQIDPTAARNFWDDLIRETKGQTVIFSTHYLGYAKDADLILLIENGHVAAQGTHDELMRESERYRTMFEAQSKDFT